MSNNFLSHLGIEENLVNKNVSNNSEDDNGNNNSNDNNKNVIANTKEDDDGNDGFIKMEQAPVEEVKKDTGLDVMLQKLIDSGVDKAQLVLFKDFLKKQKSIEGEIVDVPKNKVQKAPTKRQPIKVVEAKVVKQKDIEQRKIQETAEKRRMNRRTVALHKDSILREKEAKHFTTAESYRFEMIEGSNEDFSDVKASDLDKINQGLYLYRKVKMGKEPEKFKAEEAKLNNFSKTIQHLKQDASVIQDIFKQTGCIRLVLLHRQTCDEAKNWKKKLSNIDQVNTSGVYLVNGDINKITKLSERTSVPIKIYKTARIGFISRSRKYQDVVVQSKKRADDLARECQILKNTSIHSYEVVIRNVVFMRGLHQ